MADEAGAARSLQKIEDRAGSHAEGEAIWREATNQKKHPQQIAAERNLPVAHVNRAIAERQRFEEARLQRKIVIEQLRLELNKKQLKKRFICKFGAEAGKAIGALLKSEDPDAMEAGLKALTAMAGLNEKPAPGPVVQIQQNISQQASSVHAEGARSMEEALAELEMEQQGRLNRNEIIMEAEIVEQDSD